MKELGYKRNAAPVVSRPDLVAERNAATDTGLTAEDKAILQRWAFDPRYSGCQEPTSRQAINRVAGDMRNSQGIVGNVKHRIFLAHENGAELIIDPQRHDDTFFSPSRIAVY